MVLPLVVGGVMAAGALAKGIGGVMAGNKAAKGAMDAGGALVGAADVAGQARLNAYDAARGLSQQGQELDRAQYDQSYAMNRGMFGQNMAEQRDAYGDITRQNQWAYRNNMAGQRAAYNPLIEQGDQYRNAMAYNDGFGDRPDGYREFTGTPGYQFRRGEADDALNNRLAAMGSLNSGAAVQEAMRVADGMASQEHQLHYNRLAAGAQQGAQARSALANNTTAIRQNLASGNNAARSNLANNRTALRGQYAQTQNAAGSASLRNQLAALANQQQIGVGRGEALATRATDAANAYASARMGAVDGQTQAMQAGAAIPGNMMNAAMSGYSMGGGSLFGGSSFNPFGNPGTQGVY